MNVSRFACKSYNFASRFASIEVVFAYRPNLFRLHDLNRFTYIQVFSPTLDSKYCEDRWKSLQGAEESYLTVAGAMLNQLSYEATHSKPHFGSSQSVAFRSLTLCSTLWKWRVLLICEPASHVSHNASHASQGASHASHHFNVKKNIQ